jgi:hypothetical protein
LFSWLAAVTRFFRGRRQGSLNFRFNHRVGLISIRADCFEVRADDLAVA